MQVKAFCMGEPLLENDGVEAASDWKACPDPTAEGDHLVQFKYDRRISSSSSAADNFEFRLFARRASSPEEEECVAKSVSVARDVCLGAPFALALHPTRPQTQPGGLGTLLVRVKKCAGPATKPSPALRQLEAEGRGETHGASFQGGWEAKCTTLPGEGEVRNSMREEGIVSSPPITASRVKGEVISAPMEGGKPMVASPENASSEWMLSLVEGIVSRASSQAKRTAVMQVERQEREAARAREECAKQEAALAQATKDGEEAARELIEAEKRVHAAKVRRSVVN
ncbi:MAG: hypothetical protein SGPRY_000520 [Prymnesium sp.]